ncbi:sclerostin domain-containing protein 1a [Lampris incognitus]|uniref:sclerostin domain-containing protein 1a n=1 Tax=Lampris incognitus TaxID=2546036 RepID=UPI0024B51012|nr:sclerostin domain-containing protein 1a [Lampris incognitus]
MQLSAWEPCHFLFLLCVLLRSCRCGSASHNAGVRYPDGSAPARAASSNVTLNRARYGGRGAGAAAERGERGQIGCRELRSTKYISDGQCTSVNPIKELVCAGECLPAQILPNWIGGSYGRKFWSRRSSEDWRCVNDKTRTQRIQLQCQDGSARTYKITVVTSCKCKRYSRQHNESAHKFEESGLRQPQLLSKHKSKSKGKLGKNRLAENWYEMEP